MRKDWHSYFMDIAEMVSTRSTCDRKEVGAVIVKGKNILATGYNGSIAGLEHCDEVGHDMVAGHCVRTIHAEQNAIVQAAKHGIMIDGADIYVNTYPCWNRFKLLANSGIKKIFFKDAYNIDPKIPEAARKLNIEITEIDGK
ncbi:cytidine/deoxycytidylate deaminase family protein [Candidatus Dependentiae bacterium]|nr:cytidine/deoxycytidylate deaminase family protein [Candidatus Dependentiae bacterium]